MPIHVLARVNTDPADGRAVNLNTKFHFRLFAYGSLQEFVCVLDRVRMREEIAYPQPDLAIVRVLATDSASSSRHGRIVHRSSTSCIDYSLFELDTRFLHLAIRQQPDK